MAYHKNIHWDGQFTFQMASTLSVIREGQVKLYII